MKTLATLGALLLLVALGGLASCRTVSSGYVGVQTTFGRVHAEPPSPGVHFVNPFVDGVTQLETRLKSHEVTASAASKDLQIVKTKISVQHSLNAATAPQSYSQIGDLDRFDVAVVDPAVMESLKEVTAKYTAEELITKREIVKQQVSVAIKAFIDHTLAERNISGAVQIANVAIKDFDFSHEFNASIESKVKAQQEALRAENEKVKRLTDASAAAGERKLQADAEAYQLEKVSIQRAAAIEREAKALSANPLLLQLRSIEKWSGVLPQFMGQGPVPFINTEAMSKR